MKSIDLKRVTIPPSVVEMVPESVARENCVIPVAFEQNILRLAVADPATSLANLDTLEKLVFILNLNIEPLLANRDDLLAAIDRHYGKSNEADLDDS